MNVDNSDVDFQFGPGMTLSGNTAGGNPALVHWDFNAESVRYNPYKYISSQFAV